MNDFDDVETASQSLLPDNTSGQIRPEDVREVVTALVDACRALQARVEALETMVLP